MSRRILKFVVETGETSVLTADVPRFLAVGTQGQRVVVWAEATPPHPAGNWNTATTLLAVMTGEPVPAGEYIGTTQVGPIVVHVYRLSDA